MKRFEQFQDQIARLYPDKIREAQEKSGDDKEIILSKPITFCVTNACQLRCTYCYEQHKGNDYMSFETAKKFIDMILSGEKGASLYISPDNSPAVVLEFIGGEPFLAIDLIDQIVDYWRDTTTELMHPWADKFLISICSNGVDYFNPKVQRFLEKNKNQLSFSVTIDGNKELHNACRVYAGTTRGCYDEAVKAANDWISRGNYMGSKMTYAPENINYMHKAMMHMIDLGYKEINSNCAYEPEWSIEDAKIFYEQGKKIAQDILDRNLDLERDYYIAIFDETFFKPKDEDDLQNWCGGNGVMIACDWDGEIYPCIRYMEMSLGNDQPKLPIGNVEDGIMQCHKHLNCVECLKNIDRRTQSTDECFYCPIAEGCSWCTAWNYQLFGTPDKRCTNICIMHKSRALFNAWFWPRYYEKNNIDKIYNFYMPDEWSLEIVNEDELNEIKSKCNISNVNLMR